MRSAESVPHERDHKDLLLDVYALLILNLGIVEIKILHHPKEAIILDNIMHWHCVRSCLRQFLLVKKLISISD